MINILELLFEISVISISLSILLIRVFAEYTAKQSEMVGNLRIWTLVYFFLLLFSAFISLAELILNLFTNFLNNSPCSLILPLGLAVGPFILALVILTGLVFKIYPAEKRLFEMHKTRDNEKERKTPNEED